MLFEVENLEDRLYKKNVYRVILTRARQNMIIFKINVKFFRGVLRSKT